MNCPVCTDSCKSISNINIALNVKVRETRLVRETRTSGSPKSSWPATSGGALIPRPVCSQSGRNISAIVIHLWFYWVCGAYHTETLTLKEAVIYKYLRRSYAPPNVRSQYLEKPPHNAMSKTRHGYRKALSLGGGWVIINGGKWSETEIPQIQYPATKTRQFQLAPSIWSNRS